MTDQTADEFKAQLAARQRALAQIRPDEASARTEEGTLRKFFRDREAAGKTVKLLQHGPALPDPASSAAAGILRQTAATAKSIEALTRGPDLRAMGLPEPPSLKIPDNLADLARNAQRAQDERLSAVIEKHTRPLENALRESRESAREDAHHVQRLHRIVVLETAALIVLTVLLVAAGALAILH